MTKINLLFTCPHDGRKRGSTAIPPIIRRDVDNFSDEICRAADGQGFNIENDLSTKELTEKIVKYTNNNDKITRARRDMTEYAIGT